MTARSANRILLAMAVLVVAAIVGSFLMVRSWEKECEAKGGTLVHSAYRTPKCIRAEEIE